MSFGNIIFLKDDTVMMISDVELKSLVGYFEVSTTSLVSGYMIVKVLDVRGRIAKTIKQSVEEGIDKISLNIEDLKKGKYVFNIFNGTDFVRAVHYTKN